MQFRIFDTTGHEKINEVIKVSSEELENNTWVNQIAHNPTIIKSNFVKIGVKDDSTNSAISFDENNLVRNKVWLSNSTYHYTLDLREIK